MKKHDLTWNTGALFICTKCGKSFPEGQQNCGEELKNYLKSEIKKAGLAQEIRVMTSSCLSVCLDGLQAVTYIPVQGKSIELTKSAGSDASAVMNAFSNQKAVGLDFQENLTLDPVAEKDDLLTFLKKKAVR